MKRKPYFDNRHAHKSGSLSKYALATALILVVLGCDLWDPRVAPEVTVSKYHGSTDLYFKVSLSETPEADDLLQYSLYDASGALWTSSTTPITNSDDQEIKIIDLDEGMYELYVYVEGATGTRLTPALDLPKIIYIDTTVPDPPGVDTDSGNYDFPFYLSILDHDPGLTPETVHFTIDTTTPDSDSPVFISPYIVADDTTLKLIRFDSAGNTSDVSTYTYTGNPAPTVTISTANPVSSTNASTTLSATATGATTYLWTVESGAGGNFGTETALTTTFTGSTGGEATYLIRCTVTNASELTAYDEITVYWDDLDPAVEVGTDIGPTDATSTVSASIIESSIASVLWTSDTGNVTFGNEESATTTIIGVAGATQTHVLTCTVTDAAGNTGSDTLSFEWDDGTPAASISTVDPVSWRNTAASLTTTVDADHTSYLWEVISGRTGAALSTPTAQTTNFTGPAGIEDEYVIRFTAADDAGNSSSDEITVLWDDAAPSVLAGADISATDDAAPLSATISDLSPYTVAWSSSPTSATFTDSTSPSTDVSGMADAAQEYILTCTVTDAAGNASTDTINFSWDDLPPTATITTSDPVDWTDVAASLSATTDGTTYHWEVVSGRNGGNFSDRTSTTTNFTGPASTEEVYVVRFIAFDDARNSASSELTVLWDDAEPTVHAGSDIGSTNDSAPLSATISDLSPYTVAWTSAPGTATFTDSTSPSTYVSGIAGAAQVYVLTCTVTDSAGNSSNDTVSFSWDNLPPTAALSTPDPVSWTNSAATLVATSDDVSAAYLWEVISGRTGSTFTTPTATTTDFEGPTGIEDEYVVRFTARDSAGNSKSDEITVLWDDAAPDCSVPSALTVTDDAFYAIGATIDERGSGITSISWTINTGAATLQNTDSSVVLVRMDNPGDSVTLDLTVTDNAGNPSTTVSITVDRSL